MWTHAVRREPAHYRTRARLAGAVFLATWLLAGCTEQTNSLSLLPLAADSGMTGGATATGGASAASGADGSAAPSGGGTSGTDGSAPSTGTGGTGGGSGGAPATVDAGGCRADRDCPRASPFCDKPTATCVQCLSDGACSSRRCDASLHVCVGCASNSECRSPTPFCDVDDRRCVECLGPANCPGGYSCAFDSHQCRPSCQGPDDCVGSGRQYCAQATGVCNECLTDANCPTLKPRCDTKTGSCVCYSNADCHGGTCQPDDHVCGN